MVDHPAKHTWNSYALACGDSPYAKRCRRGYERAFGTTWQECRIRLESAFADKLPETYDPDVSATHYEAPDGKGGTCFVRLRLTQLAHTRIALFSGDGILARTEEFAKTVWAKLNPRFPGADGHREIEFLARYDDSEPPRIAA